MCSKTTLLANEDLTFIWNLRTVWRPGFAKTQQSYHWATPLVLGRKMNGVIRLCGNYLSTMNSTTKKAAYTLPTTTERFANLREGAVFSALNLAQAYQRQRGTEDTAAVLTVNTLKKLFRVKRLSFGVYAALEILHRFMKTTLAGVRGASVHLDYNIVSRADCREHAEHLHEVFHRLKSDYLQLK